MHLQIILGQLRGLIENRLDGKVVNLPSVRRQYIAFVQESMPTRTYALFPDDMERWLEALSGKYTADIMANIHQLVLTDLMLSSLCLLDSKRLNTQHIHTNTHHSHINAPHSHIEMLPPVIIESVLEWFGYLVESMTAGDYEPDLVSDLFRKDLAISALNMWPSSSICHYERRTLPRRFLTANGIAQFASATDMLLRKIKDRRYMYEFHMEDRRKNPHFLEAGWREFYLEIAQRLTTEPHISGIFAQSWFWDPEVSKACPKMKYLRALPQAGGAMFYLIEECDDPFHVSLQNKKRQRLYDQKRYVPKSYLMIWPREAMLCWAKK